MDFELRPRKQLIDSMKTWNLKKFSTSELVHAVEAYYALNVERISLTHVGPFGSVYKLWAKNGECYAAKVEPKSSHYAVAQGLALSQTLLLTRAYTPRIKPPILGAEALHVQLEAGTLWLAQWINGKPCRPVCKTPLNPASFGDLVGDLHKAILASGTSYTAPVKWRDYNDCLMQWDTLALRLSKISAPFARKVLDLIRQYLLLYSKVPPVRELPLTIGRIFGDLYISQILLRKKDHARFLLDWSAAGQVGVVADELASCLVRSFPAAASGSSIAVANFIQAYRMHLSLTAFDWLAVVERMTFGLSEALLAHYQLWLKGAPGTRNQSWEKAELLLHNSLLVMLNNPNEMRCAVSRAIGIRDLPHN